MPDLLGLAIGYPGIAGAIALAFAALWRMRGSRSAALAAAVWLLYCAWEYGMHFRVLCPGECNIRVDLLLIYPVLLALSLTALASSFRRRKQRPASARG